MKSEFNKDISNSLAKLSKKEDNKVFFIASSVIKEFDLEPEVFAMCMNDAISSLQDLEFPTDNLFSQKDNLDNAKLTNMGLMYVLDKYVNSGKDKNAQKILDHLISIASTSYIEKRKRYRELNVDYSKRLSSAINKRNVSTSSALSEFNTMITKGYYDRIPSSVCEYKGVSKNSYLDHATVEELNHLYVLKMLSVDALHKDNELSIEEVKQIIFEKSLRYKQEYYNKFGFFPIECLAHKQKVETAYKKAPQIYKATQIINEQDFETKKLIEADKNKYNANSQKSFNAQKEQYIFKNKYRVDSLNY